MSPKEDEPFENTFASLSKTPSSESGSQKERQGPANTIQFVDDQDPNKKSHIQRHTAYHSAAQRREARLKSLARGGLPRYLEWGRRESGLSTSPPSTTNSLSVSPVNAPGMAPSSAAQQEQIKESEPAPSQNPSGLSISPRLEDLSQIQLLSPSEESVIDAFKQFLVSNHESDTSEALTIATMRNVGPTGETAPSKTTALASSGQEFESGLDGILAFVRSDEACLKILVAYCYALRSRTWPNFEGTTDTDTQAAQHAFGRGTYILWNRLRRGPNLSSDINMQAVLLLLVYTLDFGSSKEVDMHRDALSTMLEERGGVEALNSQPVLQQQLQSLSTSRRYHMTLTCNLLCGQPLRFADGGWLARKRQLLR